jgi:hypothetical protein
MTPKSDTISGRKGKGSKRLTRSTAGVPVTSVAPGPAITPIPVPQAAPIIPIGPYRIRDYGLGTHVEIERHRAELEADLTRTQQAAAEDKPRLRGVLEEKYRLKAEIEMGAAGTITALRAQLRAQKKLLKEEKEADSARTIATSLYEDFRYYP